jgi:hypothetical protein
MNPEIAMSSVRSKLAGLFATVLLALGAFLTLAQSRLERDGVLLHWALVALALLSFGAAYDLYARWIHLEVVPVRRADECGHLHPLCMARRRTLLATLSAQRHRVRSVGQAHLSNLIHGREHR